MKVTHWIIIGMGLVIIAMILFDKDDLSNQQHADYQRIANEWKAKAWQAVAQSDSILSDAIKRKEKDSIVIKAQDSKIKALTTKAAVRRPQVIERIQADTAVLSYVTTLEEVVGELQIQNDTLKSTIAFHIQVEKDLSRNSKVMKEAFEQQIIHTQALADAYKKDARKSKRANRWTKAGVVVLGVGGFLLGSQF